MSLARARLGALPEPQAAHAACPHDPALVTLCWRTVREPPPLAADTVHLWRIALDESAGDAGAAWLTSEEHAHAAQLHQTELRRRCLSGHAARRAILGGYLATAPAELRFARGAAGKPMLVGVAQPLEFNFSASGALALLAVSLAEPIGVDCEWLRARVDAVAIARRMFGVARAAELAALPETACWRAFYRDWTALEARVKRDGRGLARHRVPDPPDIAVAHAAPAPGAICALARRRLPPPSAWQTFRFSAGMACPPR